VVEERGPSLLLNGTVLVTGQVERLTPFEKGFPLQEARTEAGWEPDTWIWDDQAIAVNVRGRGVVILSSCSHSGAINVANHVMRMTGVETVYAFVGGFHLTGGLFEPIIPATVAAMVQIAPDIVVPGHCTGWVAHRELAAGMGDAYLPSNVGTTLRFLADDGCPYPEQARRGANPS
jgi:7,8-dihydropterin-6-yl-methyl-4-(beta-D-ribofuranosyl)aminobenzene 5'-phosphate synthase